MLVAERQNVDMNSGTLVASFQAYCALAKSDCHGEEIDTMRTIAAVEVSESSRVNTTGPRLG